MKNLVVDAGNTRIKWALFDDNKIIDKGYDWATWPAFTQTDKVLISNVGKTIDTRGLPKAQILNSTIKLPITLDYQTPETLGGDRIAAAVGAYKLANNKPVLIIDIGTCIKCDFVSAEGAFKGGSISPGINLRFKSLNDYTEKLPLLAPTQWSDILGNSTANSIYNGVMNGVKFEIQGFIQAHLQSNPQLCVFLSGGDSAYFENDFKVPTFAEPDLILIGLNEILQYQ